MVVSLLLTGKDPQLTFIVHHWGDFSLFPYFYPIWIELQKWLLSQETKTSQVIFINKKRKDWRLERAFVLSRIGVIVRMVFLVVCRKRSISRSQEVRTSRLNRVPSRLSIQERKSATLGFVLIANRKRIVSKGGQATASSTHPHLTLRLLLICEPISLILSLLL